MNPTLGRNGRSARSFARRGTAIAAAAVLAAGLSACGPDIGSASGPAAGGAMLEVPANASPKGEITIWDRSGDLFKVFDAAIRKFTEKYPGITVHHEAVDIDSKLQNTLITGTDVPDGVFLDDAKVGGYVEHLYNLKDVLAPYTKDIAKQKVDVNTVNGGIYGVPFDLDPGLLFYNAKALSAAGIDPNGIKTYDDLLAAAKKYQQYKPGAKPIHLEQNAFNSQLQLEMYASQLGTSLAGADGQLRLNSAPYQQILTWLDTVQKDGLGTRAEYLKPSDVGALDSGDEVFYPWAIWFDYAPQQQLTATKGDWRAMALPAWSDGGARSGAMGGSSFVIPKDAKNPQLSWLLYQFLTFDQAGYTAVYGPNEVYPGGTNTSIPAYQPAADPAKPLFQPIDAMGGQDLWQTAVEAGRQIPGGAPIPVWWDGAVDYLGTDLQKMLDGSMTPQQVIDQAGKDIQTNLIERK
ncbi:extracellular solute-binding protein [Amycolatopsis acidiphila]|uniref:Sugar ABC transporter substrate-binding protein n=1 Tax=Amycolatopsis acidiphila TaxID=715473 RepID=A0A558ANW2_9PSEU|nr:extracellular solute-binding protein [Amycolatopsis acidiphila]TVT25952.1 sugar ABC transporter substrate-binding protein [Amycolatopsis acidiphila]UIJ63337.1 extracellular solute-binding protein [Amycolatopsis acidiphila]GHG75096.1 sugar transporter [Amycolatopsis acidiphila]